MVGVSPGLGLAPVHYLPLILPAWNICRDGIVMVTLPNQAACNGSRPYEQCTGMYK